MKSLFRIAGVLMVAAIVLFTVGYLRPGLLPNGPAHPRSLMYALQGKRLHPYVRLNPKDKYVVHFWDVRWPVFRKEMLDYESYLEYAIQGFMANYPNVRVEVRLFDLTTDEDYLRHAINTGERPDVISAPFGEWFVERGLIADLSAMFEKGHGYVSSAMSSVTKDGKIWAYPRWLDLHLLVANAKALREKGVDPDSTARPLWTWSQFAASMAKVNRGGTPPFVLNTLTLDGLQSLVETTGGTLPFDTKGNFTWTKDDLTRALSVVSNLQSKGIISNPPGRASSALLESIWGNRGAVYGPFGSGLLRHIRERKLGLVFVPPNEKESEETEVALLPVPADIEGHPPLHAGLMSLMVLQHGSAAQMRAAAAFAEYLSTGHFPKITEALQVVSAYKPNIDKTLSALIATSGKGWIRDCLFGEGPSIGPFDTPLCPPNVAFARRLDKAVKAYWEKPSKPEALLSSLHKALTESRAP